METGHAHLPSMASLDPFPFLSLFPTTLILLPGALVYEVEMLQAVHTVYAFTYSSSSCTSPSTFLA